MTKNDNLHLEGQGVKEFDRLRKYLGLVYLYGCFDAETLGKINSRSAKDYYAMIQLAQELFPLVKTNDMYRSGKGKSLRYERKYDASARNRMADCYMMCSLDKVTLLLLYLRVLQRLQHGGATIPALGQATDGFPVDMGDVEQTARYHMEKIVQYGYAQKDNAVYSLVNDGLSELTDEALQELHTYVCFTSGVTYPRVPGSFLQRTLERELRHRGMPIYEDSVLLLRNNSHHIVFDEEVVFRFLQLIQDRQAVVIDNQEYLPVKMRIDSRLGRWYVLMAQEYQGKMQPVIRSCSRLMFPEAIGEENNPKWEAALAAVEAAYPENESLFSGIQTEKPTLVEVKLCFGAEKGRQNQFFRELRLGSIKTLEHDLIYQVQIRDPLELMAMLRAYSPWSQILPGDHDLCKRMEESLQQMQEALDGTAWAPHPEHHRSLEKRSSGAAVIRAVEQGKKKTSEKGTDINPKEWKLFNPFQGRLLQFALDLLSDASQNGDPTDISKSLAKRYGFYEEKRILDLLKAGGFFDSSVRPRLPMSAVERDYLKYILDAYHVPEVSLFLSDQTRQALALIVAKWDKPNAPASRTNEVFNPNPPKWAKHIQWPRATGMELPRHPGAESFRDLIGAIRDRKMISYRYRIRMHPGYQEATCLPWKLEYSAYDRRWWIILYDPLEDRTIKTPVNNLREIRVMNECSVPESKIWQAMERLRMEKPVVLHIRDSHNALQRCFTLFENQEISGSNYSAETGYILKMHAFRFDREEFLRQLMYLGPNVRLVEPMDLREELRQRLEQALKHYTSRI